MKRWLMIIILAVLALAGIMMVSVNYFILGRYRSLQTTIAVRKLNDVPTTMPAPAEDWPRWRGPRGDGISREPIAPWKGPQPLQLWAADVGLGYASPIAAKGRIYLFSLNNKQETLTAFDAQSGRVLWSQAQPVGWTISFPGTRATPAIDGDRIYTYGGAGDLVCRELDGGKEVWSVNILQKTSAGNIGWGVACSPLVAGDMVYVQGGKDGPIAVAVNKQTGAIAWTSAAKGLSGYAHPIIADVGGWQQLVVFGGDAIWGLDAASGKTIWTEPWKTSYDVNASTPIYADGNLFITSGYDRGCMMLRPSATGVTRLWENKSIASRFQGAILDGGLLLANSNGTLKCLSWPDGSVKWTSQGSKLRPGTDGSMVRSGQRLLILSERGMLSLVSADAKGMELLCQGQLLEGNEIWATPLIYGQRLYAKGMQELVCFELPKP